jgi:localization factor PodJL
MLKKAWFTRLFSGRTAASQQDLQSRADESGAEAQNNLGALFANSDLPGPAAVSYLKAARDGNAMAQHNLAMMYATGEGVNRDEVEAGVWFARSAAQGDAGAQFHLGDRCFRASLSAAEAEADEALIESFKWLQLSSAQGYPNAETCRERVNLRMSREHVAEGKRRVAAFAARHETPAREG